jgi:hypothetical protein
MGMKCVAEGNFEFLCGLVRVPEYKSRGLEFDFKHYQIF